MLQTALFSEALSEIAEETEYGLLPFLLVFEAAMTDTTRKGKDEISPKENTIELLRTVIAIGFLSYEENTEKLKEALSEAGIQSSSDFSHVTEKLVEQEIMKQDSGDDLGDFDGIFEIENLEAFLLENETLEHIAALKTAEAPITKWTVVVSGAILVASFFIDLRLPYIQVIAIIGISAGLVLSEWERKWRTN